MDKDKDKIKCYRCKVSKLARHFISPKLPSGYRKVCNKCLNLEKEAKALKAKANRYEEEAVKMRKAAEVLKEGVQKCVGCGLYKPVRGKYFKPSNSYTKIRTKCNACYSLREGYSYLNTSSSTDETP